MKKLSLQRLLETLQKKKDKFMTSTMFLFICVINAEGSMDSKIIYDICKYLSST